MKNLTSKLLETDLEIVNKVEFIVLTNARIIDPSQNINAIGNVVIHNGNIHAINTGCNTKDSYINAYGDNCFSVDCSELILCPGFIDTAVEISSLNARAINKLTKKAAQAGVTSIILGPNILCQKSILDNPENIELLNNLAQHNAVVKCYALGALSLGLAGESIAEYGLMKNSGALGLSNGKHAIANADMLQKAMTYAKDFDLTIFNFALDPYLSYQYLNNTKQIKQTNDCLLASWMGLNGESDVAEVISLHRDLCLANSTKSHYHSLIISSQKSISLISEAKNNKQNITASTSIFHLCFNDNDIGNYNSLYRTTPPLRTEENRQALVQAAENGIIDCLISDYVDLNEAPQCEPYSHSQQQNHSLDLLLPLSLRLYHNGELSISRIIELLSTNVAKVLNIDAGTIKVGKPADIAVIAPDEPVIVHKHALQGKVKATFVNGKLIFIDK